MGRATRHADFGHAASATSGRFQLRNASHPRVARWLIAGGPSLSSCHHTAVSRTWLSQGGFAFHGKMDLAPRGRSELAQTKLRASVARCKPVPCGVSAPGLLASLRALGGSAAPPAKLAACACVAEAARRRGVGVEADVSEGPSRWAQSRAQLRDTLRAKRVPEPEIARCAPGSARSSRTLRGPLQIPAARRSMRDRLR